MACGVALAALTTGPRVHADEPIALRVRVVAEGDCAIRGTFWSAVSRHSNRVRETLGADGALVEVAIRRADEEHVVGVLEVTPPAPAVAPSVLTPAEPAAREAPLAPAAVPDARWRGAVLASIGPLVLGTSGAVVGYGISGDLERDRAGLAPSFRLSLTHAEGSTDLFGAGAELAWTTGRASICPLRADLASSISLRPCAGLDVGVLVASPVGLVSARSATRAWAAPSLLGRLRWLVGASILVEGEVGLAAPLVRDEIGAEPGLTLYRAPALVPLASLSVGVRFP